MYKIGCIFFFFMSCCGLYAQNIKGTIKDNNGNLILFSNVLVFDSENRLEATEFKNAKSGVFELDLKKNYKSVIIEISHSNYFKTSQKIENIDKNGSYALNFILEKNTVKELEEITIVSPKKPITIKKDTTTYNISSFKDISDSKLQDVLKKMPGIDVNEKTGQVKFKGKPIETVTLDGDNLFGHNYTLATKSINIDMIEQVQAIENYNENKLLKGIENSDKVSLNLKLKKGVSDYSGTIDLGIGKGENKLLNSNSNILRISSKVKSFGVLAFNNVGLNNTPFDNLSGSLNEDAKNDKLSRTNTIISESIFSNLLDDERANINNQYFVNYNLSSKISNKTSIKANAYYLNDKINFQRDSQTTNTFENVFTTSDFFNSRKKPQLFRGDFEFKSNTSQNSLLEFSNKSSYETIKTISKVQSNNSNQTDINLGTQNLLLIQKFLFTNKISSTKAFQFEIKHSLNDIPQVLSLTSEMESINQKSNFKRQLLESKINFLGNYKQLKYAFSFKGILSRNSYLSSNSFNESNAIEYNTKTLENSGSLNYNYKLFNLNTIYSVKLINQKLLDVGLNNLNTQNNILFEPLIRIKYKLNNNSFLKANTSIDRNLVSDEYLFRNNVVLNNRSKISNIPELVIQKSFANSLNYIYNNMINQFSANLGVNYQENVGGFISAFKITNNQTVVENFYINEKTNNLAFNLSVKKLLFSIKTLVDFKTNYTITNYKNAVNTNALRNNINESFNSTLSLKTAFDTKINFDNNFIYNYQSNKNQDSNKLSNKSIINVLKINYKYTTQTFFGITYEYYLPTLSNPTNKIIFLDFNMRYKPEKSKFEYNLVGKNLTNNNSFSQNNTTDYSSSVLSNSLIKRYLLLNITYVF